MVAVVMEEVGLVVAAQEQVEEEKVVEEKVVEE